MLGLTEFFTWTFEQVTPCKPMLQASFRRVQCPEYPAWSSLSRRFFWIHHVSLHMLCPRCSSQVVDPSRGCPRCSIESEHVTPKTWFDEFGSAVASIVLRLFVAIPVWLLLLAMAGVSVMPDGGQSIFVTTWGISTWLLVGWLLWPLTRLLPKSRGQNDNAG